jgi:predicted phage terminase large subunit-like protein
MMTSLINSSKKTAARLAKEEKARRLAQRSLTAYKRLVYRRYQHALHLDALDRLLEQVTLYVETGGKEGIGRAVIEMPPRHGKTMSVSKLYPTWHLGRNPDHRIMLVSYGASLARKNSRFARTMMRTDRYQAIFGGVAASDNGLVYWDLSGSLTLDPHSAAAEAWDLAPPYEGGMDAMGIDGAATGKGAHVLIIDDPIKNRADAESELIRDKIWEAFIDDLMTRLEPGGAVIVMMTRWHEDDQIGRLDKYDPEGWVHLRLPALAEENDPLGRAPGEALWAARYPVETLLEIKRKRSPYSWASLYQQRPIPREGGLFKWQDIHDHRTDSYPDLVRVVVGVDPSGSSDGDEIGIVTGGLARDGHVYIIEDASRHGSPAQWGRAVVAAYHKHQADRVVAEKNYGGDMVESVIRTVESTVSYEGVPATRGKELRAEPVASLYEQGLVHHVGEFEQLEDEMTTWKPGKKSPNRMDALVWVITALALDEEKPAKMRQVKRKW